MMDTITKTFSKTLNTSYTENSIIELVHFRDMVFDDERVGCYLESFFTSLNLSSFKLAALPNLEGYETDLEKDVIFKKTEATSEKLGLRILERKNNIGDWSECTEVMFLNRGRKDYFDLMTPYLAIAQVRLLERNDALAIQLVDYGNGLLWDTDFIKITATATVTIPKKNDELTAAPSAIVGAMSQPRLTEDTIFDCYVNESSTQILPPDVERYMIKLFLFEMSDPAVKVWIKYGEYGYEWNLSVFSHPLPYYNLLIIDSQQAGLNIAAICTSGTATIRVSYASKAP
ncbi:MAG: hypothetical protein WBL95_21145 [Microcoleus sp.]